MSVHKILFVLMTLVISASQFFLPVMSSDGKLANITITQIAFEAQAPLSPLVPLSGWEVDPLYTNAPYALSSTESSLSLELDAVDAGSKVSIMQLNAPKLQLSNYGYVNVTVTGSSNARILLRFFMDDGSSFDVVYWADPATLNAVMFDLSPYAGRTLTGLVYVGLMSSDGTALGDVSEDRAASALATTEESLVLAYQALSKAYESGANVSSLLIRLNESGWFLARAQVAYKSGDFDSTVEFAAQSHEKLNGFVADAAALRETATQEHYFDFTVNVFGSIIGAIGVVCVSFLVWFFLKRKHERAGSAV